MIARRAMSRVPSLTRSRVVFVPMSIAATTGI
jgi:hypothetical protein